MSNDNLVRYMIIEDDDEEGLEVDVIKMKTKKIIN
jgi:hypothetical protein